MKKLRIPKKSLSNGLSTRKCPASPRVLLKNSGLYSTSSSFSLHSYFFTGFVDAEGCFNVTVSPGARTWKVILMFSIHLQTNDLSLLYKIQAFLGGIGTIRFGRDNKSATFSVAKLDDIVNIIIPHFKKYPLESCKAIDFQLWAQCAELMKNKEHLTEEGLKKIIALKFSINKGLSDKLKAAFPDVTPVARPVHTVSNTPLNPNWVSGFTDADGSFTVSITQRNQVLVIFQIELLAREEYLIRKIQEFFFRVGGGWELSNITFPRSGRMARFTVTKQNYLMEVIIPHFDTYKLEGNKLKNYLIWKEILLLVKDKSHLTPGGLVQIIELKNTINKV
jgi:hypothetical protein